MNSIGNLYNRIFKQAYKDGEGNETRKIELVDMNRLEEK